MKNNYMYYYQKFPFIQTIAILYFKQFIKYFD